MELKIKKSDAIQAYQKADQKGKELLANLLGAENVKPGDLLSYVKTFTDVCNEAGLEPEGFMIMPTWTAEDKERMHRRRIMLIATVFNQGWVPDLADASQYKWYPWFKIIPDKSKPSGFGLSCSGCVYGGSGSGLGARPYFKDQKTAVYVGKQFLDEFEAWAQQLNQCLQSIF
jgi:hypothetical protein